MHFLQNFTSIHSKFECGFQCYMGWRSQELVILKLDKINIDEWYMTGGMKTDAGKQRIVPIHTKIPRVHL